MNLIRLSYSLITFCSQSLPGSITCPACVLASVGLLRAVSSPSGSLASCYRRSLQGWVSSNNATNNKSYNSNSNTSSNTNNDNNNNNTEAAWC